MKWYRGARVLGVLLLLASRMVASAQDTSDVRITPYTFSLRTLREDQVHVPGQGAEVQGIDPAHAGDPRYMVGDDPGYAARNLVDTGWMALRLHSDTMVPGQGVHWARFHLLPDAGLKQVALVLDAGARTGFDVFLNGVPVLHSAGIAPTSSAADLPLSDSLLLMSTPLVFACDGAMEVLAVRINGAAGASLDAAGLQLSLHAPDTTYARQRRMVHLGLFIGVDLIIFLLALVIWSLERRERSWLLLALLSFVSALDTFCDLGDNMVALGFGDPTSHAIGFINTILIPWPLYLLIMVLGVLRGDLSRKRARWYTVAALLVTLICGAFGIGQLYGLMDGTSGISVLNDSLGLVIAVIIGAIIFGLIVAWFGVDVVRLGIRLLRSKGYERWIGAGALASSLFALALQLVSQLTGVGLSSWLEILSDYCSSVAVPVSVAVYLAIRSAHHNKLVARQRDDLNEEVKERTAQLSAEKERSDELLLNILPEEVAEELKRTGAAAAKHFDTASVLFTDFKGFTALSEKVGATELLHELNICFKAFDDIIGARGIEKIKTIGDAYMCAGGLPDPTSSTPIAVVHAALEMQAFMAKHKAERIAQNKPFFEMRVGIHSGPVVAGIVGVKKFAYDIWGDTVNTASRMESSGEVGEVNISGTTYALVKDEPDFTFTHRGKIQAKGKGEMEMYYVSQVNR